MYLLFIVGLLYEAVLTSLVAGLSLWRPLFDPRPVYVTAIVKNGIRIGYYRTTAVLLGDYRSSNAPHCLGTSDCRVFFLYIYYSMPHLHGNITCLTELKFSLKLP
jgi:hypothetical protein